MILSDLKLVYLLYSLKPINCSIVRINKHISWFLVLNSTLSFMRTRVYHQICRLLYHRRLSDAFFRCFQRSLLLYLRSFHCLSLWNFWWRCHFILQRFDTSGFFPRSHLTLRPPFAFPFFCLFFFNFFDVSLVLLVSLLSSCFLFHVLVFLSPIFF